MSGLNPFNLGNLRPMNEKARQVGSAPQWANACMRLEVYWYVIRCQAMTLIYTSKLVIPLSMACSIISAIRAVDSGIPSFSHI